MKRKMKKTIKTMLCTMLALSFILTGTNCFTMDVYAAEQIGATKNVDLLEAELMDISELKPSVNNAKTALTDCTISFSKNSSGLHIEIKTGCGNGMASYLGVKDVKIEKKVWYGWQTIATGSGGQQSNCSIMGISIDYPNVTAGETYRISCVHYGDYDGYHELANNTGAFVY